MFSLVSTRVGVIMSSSSTKPDSGVTGTAIILLVTKDTNPCFRPGVVGRKHVEPFFVAVGLQGRLGAN